ncbi:uncharacterized protein LOC123211448 [Mangifera indica]|uniref:uncharacterized protein LOC123211448 n=1 Tax=Mangifera indica TaxID=29780 RepID=UPI001CFB9420|nr:uncharacterized protein LOC123211448 [Mangifera indica]
MERHTPHHKRTIAATPDPKSSMDPTLKKHSNKTNISTKTSHSTSQKNPDSSTSSKPFYYMTNSFSRLNLYHNKVRSSQKHSINPPTKDIHLQAKALTVSADSDSSKFLLVKPSKLMQPQQKGASRYEKDGRIKEENSKEMMKKLSKGGPLNSKKKEVHKEEVYGKELVLVRDKDVKNLPHEGHDVKRVPVSLGRRRSFYGSQVELAGALANCGVKVVSVDMPPFMQIHAVDFARKTYDSLEKFTAKTLALTLKKEFDGVYGPAWHCIVGTSFGSFVTHSVGGFLYFSMDQKLYILLFKTTVQKAE